MIKGKMPKPYSYDLRVKVIKFLEEGNSVQKAKKVFSISRKAIYEWKHLKEDTGDVRAKSGYHTGNRRIIKDVETFKQFVKDNNCKSGRELARMWHQKVSPSAVIKLLKDLGFTYKKNVLSSKKRLRIKEKVQRSYSKYSKR